MTTKSIVLQFWVDGCAIQRTYELGDVRTQVEDFIVYIDRAGCFDIDEAVESLLLTDQYQDGALIIEIK